MWQYLQEDIFDLMLYSIVHSQVKAFFFVGLTERPRKAPSSPRIASARSPCRESCCRCRQVGPPKDHIKGKHVRLYRILQHALFLHILLNHPLIAANKYMRGYSMGLKHTFSIKTSIIQQMTEAILSTCVNLCVCSTCTSLYR